MGKTDSREDPPLNASPAKGGRRKQGEKGEPVTAFSVVIANYNYARHVGEAIASALAQEYPPERFEVIVVDDGSTDDSVEVINRHAGDPRVRIVTQANQGQAAAFFAGLRMARHDWICFLDSDDYFNPGKLARLDAFIRHAGRDCRLICHDVDAFDEARQAAQSWFARQKVTAAHLTIDEATGGYPFANPCGQVFRREILAAIEPALDCADWKRGADNPLAWGGFFLAGRVCYLHESLAVYRIHADNHFLASTTGGLVPKVDWLARWPRLLEFLDRLDRQAGAHKAGEGDRTALLSRLRQYVQHWEGKLRRPSTGQPLVSFITTCKNRLHHLKQTLPRMARQSHAEVIVVDYGCPQGTAAWVRSNFPSVKVVEVNDDPGFKVARARNAGAAAARGEWLCFIDADMILERDLGAWVKKNAQERRFYLASPMASYTVKGTVVCRKQDYLAAGGYDEAYKGWFPEDGDFYATLSDRGIAEDSFPGAFLTPIEHGDEERRLGGVDQVETRAQGMRVSQLYQVIKRDIKQLSGRVPELKVRRALVEHLIARVKKFEHTGRPEDARVLIDMNQGMDAYQSVNLDRRLVYSFRQPKHVFRPQVESHLASKAVSSDPRRTPTAQSRQSPAVLMRIAMFHIGRSGSTVLADMLGQHSQIHWDGEVYEAQIKAIEKKLGYFKYGAVECRYNPVEILSKRMAHFGKVHYGFEVKFNHLEHCGCDMSDYMGDLKKLGINKLIVLRRKNIFRKIVSSLIAERTGAWHVPAGQSAPKGRISINPGSMMVERRTGSLIELLDHYTNGFDYLDSNLGETEVLRLTFEDDIDSDPRIAFDKTLAFLGLPMIVPKIRLAKTNPYSLVELVDNLEEVREFLADTEYGWMLDD